ncbi:disease resistance protein Roq1-like [Cryptomeria japonica]|uniref:disease resistance protein Roq1-like n=1 Tax=Cryptomeria japonica TaxID=3369 RepID=UPI0027DAA72A|nr:disease resistance protein Roq1-like [Cryptomeria japonica]
MLLFFSDEHEKKRRYSSEQLEHWKWALHKASFFTGHIINNQEDEQRVVKNVVNCVLKETNKVLLEVAKHPVGVDEAVLNFDKIAVQSDGSIKIVGIWGLGGSGKTTLAKRIFNNKCSGMDRASFLFDLRDAAGKCLLVERQKKLMKDLSVSESFDHVDEGKGILQSRLRSVSVLIILDDVDHTDQLDALLPARESLGQGSLIVVTTRELDVLIAWGISAIYEMRPLNATHAKQLFCWHAILQPSPLSGFEDLVEKFLNVSKGLPLSLKVLGAQLYGRSRKDYWQSQLDKISRILPADINSRLKVSYDALDDEEKEMFLDIACFFIGERKSVAIAVWEGSGWSGLHGWERLFNKCLVEVEDGDIGRMIWVNGGERIRMHDHLRDLGREVANGRSPYRLWSPQQSIKIHSQQEAIQIRGLVNAIGENCYLQQGNILIHTSLGERCLTLCSLGLKIFVGNGDFINQDQVEISRELVWLQCEEFEHKNLPSWLSLKKLRVLELFNARSLEGLWEREADAPLQLRELVMSRCDSLREFPRSIGHLKNLKKIIIDGNNTLIDLPQDFCYLQSLEHLEITACHELSYLPNNFGELANLQHLNLYRCTMLKMLPDSFKKLTNLQHPNLDFCIGLKVLLDSFKNLTLLEHLNLEKCGEVIINSESHVLENMTKLRYLNLNQCKKLEELRLPGVSPLTKLYLRGTSFKELPPNIFQLTNLTDLEIGNQFLQVLPSSVANLPSLTRLAIIWCKRLEALSDSLEHLNCLKIWL